MRKNIKKLYFIFLLSFFLLCFSSFPFLEKDNTLRTNFELQDISSVDMNKIYLLNDDDYLTEVDVFIGKSSLEDEVFKIFEFLKEGNREEEFFGYLPKDVQILNVEVLENTLYLVLSDEAKDISDSYLSGFVHSLLHLKDIHKVSIQIGEGDAKVFDKNYPINKVMNILDRNDILKVVVYYLDSHGSHYVPVTKYENGNEDKIHVIIEELKENIPSHLVSYLDVHTKLLDYREENNILFLNFTSDLVSDKGCEEEIVHSICYSVFHNYDVGSVFIELEGKPYKLIGND